MGDIKILKNIWNQKTWNLHAILSRERERVEDPYEPLPWLKSFA